MEYIPDRSWLHGKYEKNDDPTESNEYKYEIHTSLPYVSIGEFFCQGHDADKIIDEIHQLWINGNMTTLEAIQKWEMLYL